MRSVKHAVWGLVLAATSGSLGGGGAALSQTREWLAPRRAVVFQDADLPGGDISAYFNTSVEACERACTLDNACHAFTFNTRNNSCFTKATLDEPVFFEGAISAIIVEAGAADVSRAATRRAQLAFVGDDEFDAASALSGSLGYEYHGPSLAYEAYETAAWDAERAGDFEQAAAYMSVAVHVDDSAARWADFAALSEQASRVAGPHQARHRARAYQARLNAYLRSDDPAFLHDTLLQLARLWEEDGQGNMGLSALRLAQDIEARPETAVLLEAAAGKYGFAVSEHIVSSDLARPEVCFEFSEDLIQSGVDYSDYLRASGGDYAVELAGTRRLCVRGLVHGQEFALMARRGLPAADGQALLKDVEVKGYIRDRGPSVRFSGRGYILAAAGDAAVPVETVNTGEVTLDLYEVSDRNILRAIQNDYFGRPVGVYAEDYFADVIGAKIWSGTGAVGQELNREVITRLPLEAALKGRAPGVYALRAAVTGLDPYEVGPAWQWFVVSDLGLTTMTGADGLHVFVRGLQDAGAKAGVRAEIYSNANALLAEAVTDAAGYVHFAAGLTAGKGAAAPALLVVRDGAADVSFLSLTTPEFDLADRGVEGREVGQPIDIFMTSDRGIYRAGESVYVTALARDLEMQAIEGLTLTAVVKRPDGVEHSRHILEPAAAGGYVFELPTSASAMRGGWRVALHAGADTPALAQKTVLIEDFLPERLEVTLTADAEPLVLSAGVARFNLQADYLFGAPARDLAVEGEVTLRAADGLARWPGYRFGRYDQRFDARTLSFTGARTDASGALALAAELPYLDEDPGQPVVARVTARVAEGSGRPVERSLDVAVQPKAALLGLKPEFDGPVAEGAEAPFLIAAVDGAEVLRATEVKWTLTRVETHYQWYRSYSDWNWEPLTTRSVVASGTGRIGEAPLAISPRVDWGRYEMLVEAVGPDLGRAAPVSVLFEAGWYAPADVTLTPDVLELSLDKKDYRAGETAMVRLVPRTAGVALISVLSNRLIAMQAVDVSEGENLVPLTVTEDWGAGAYVTVSVLRPADVEGGHLPARALGLAYAKIDPGARALSTVIEVAPEADPRGPLAVAVKVEGVRAGEVGYVTLAAVDQGILNLTGFTSPDPHDHYFGQRKLGMGIRDIYGRVINNLAGGLGQVRSGGDAGAQARLQAPPPTEELLAYFTGPIEVGADGYARASFDLPSFNGAARLMAVAWSKTGVGQAEAEVLIRDPVVVSASLPRFLAPGDRSTLRLEFTHVSGSAGEMALSAEVAGEALAFEGAVPLGVTLAEGGAAVLELPIAALAPGLARVNLRLTTPEGRELRKELQLPVAIFDNPVMRMSQVELAPGERLTLDSAIFAGLYPATSRTQVALGAAARLNAPALLESLLRYPYGCAEQTTSRALPLLYLSAAEAEDLGARAEIEAAIAGVLAHQNGTGSFGLWGAGSESLWLDAYVSDFLSRARAEGFDVPALGLRQALDNLRGRVNYATDFDQNTPEGGTGLAYALYVLAREGAAAVGDLRYYADVKADDFATPLAQAQLGAALAAYGDQPRADRLMRKAGEKILASEAEVLGLREDFGSRYRDVAGVLTLAAESGSRALETAPLLAQLNHPGHSLSTQEEAWALRAGQALLAAPDLAARGLHVAGARGTAYSFAPSDAAVTIENDGGAPDLVTLTTFGVPITPEPAGGNGYNLTRSYAQLDGTPFDLNEPVAAGTRLVVRLEVSPWEGAGGRLLLDDPLPAGFEIDNPSLIAGGDIGQFAWLPASPTPKHAEFRQERFLAQIDSVGTDSFSLAYVVRAVSPGRFHHPAATLTDMYRPENTARTEAGVVTVGAR